MRAGSCFGAVAVLALAACGGERASQEPTAASSAGGAGGGAGGAGGGGGGTAAGGNGSGTGGEADGCAFLAATLQQALDDALPESKSPGAVMAVTTPQCRFVGATGQSTDTMPMSADYVLRIGSVTKTFVAATVLQLAAEGALGLDDALDAWLPEFPGGSGITLRQMLNHTSGIFNYTDDDAFIDAVLADPDHAWAPSEIADVAAAHEPYFAPGGGFHYSNSNYILLGMVVEKASGAGVGAEIRSRLLGPVGLENTFFDGEERVTADLAHGYDAGGFDVSTYLDPSWAWSAGAMVASAGDLADWANALYGGAVLDAPSQRQMLEAVETDNAGIGYGLGVMIFSRAVAGADAWGHFGDIPGYHTQMVYLVEQQSAIVSIVNSDAGSPNDITVAALDILLE